MMATDGGSMVELGSGGGMRREGGRQPVRPGSPKPDLKERRNSIQSLKMEQLAIFSAFAEETIASGTGNAAAQSSRSFFNAPTYASFKENGAKPPLEKKSNTSVFQRNLNVFPQGQSFLDTMTTNLNMAGKSGSLYEATATSSASMYTGGAAAQSQLGRRQSISFHRSARLSADADPKFPKSVHGALSGGNEFGASSHDDDEDVKSSLCSSSSDDENDVPEPEDMTENTTNQDVHR